VSIFQLTPLKVPQKGQKTEASPKPNKLKELRSSLSQMQFGAMAAKLVVVGVFTLSLLLIVLVRSRAPGDPAALEGSSLVGLAKTMQQGSISGRDFQSMYGPATQALAWMCTKVTSTRSALDSFGLITFAFCAASVVLIAAMLLVCDRISGLQAAAFYAFSLFLNLFFNVFDIRTALLLLSAAFAYRIVAAGAVKQRTAWAAATGLLCFFSQLVSFELGIYAGIVVVCALIAGIALTRNTELLHGAGAFIATFTVSNLALVAFFKLTSVGHTMVFDYHNYGFEMLRGYHNSMGILWELSLTQTITLIVASLYVLGMCAVTVWRSDRLDAVLFVSLASAAVVWLTTAFVRSDIAHIAAAFTPMVVILSFLVPKDLSEPKEAGAWAAIAAAAILAWPSSNLAAPTDLLRVARGEVAAEETFRGLHSTRRPLDKSVQESLVAPGHAEHGNVPLLAFPYDNHIVVGVRRRLFAPVLETNGVSTTFLQEYYLRALQKQRNAGLEIVYGLDRTEDPLTGGVQAITRTPDVFEYIYRNFALVSNDEHEDGHYILRPMNEPPQVVVEPLKFTTPQQTVDSGLVKLNLPSTCGLVRVEMKVGYNSNPRLFRPSGVEVRLNNGDERVWQGVIRPLEPNQKFVAYISPLPPAVFHKVFSREPIRGVQWDKFEYRSSPADLLGAKASRVEISSLDCLDPQKFGEPILPVPLTQPTPSEAPSGPQV
jgi:hypothetical protein